MQNYDAIDCSLCCETGVVLAIGATILVALAALAGRWTRSALWQRTLWQVTTLALFALLAVELTGTGRVVLCMSSYANSAGDAAAGPTTAPPQGRPNAETSPVAESADDTSAVAVAGFEPQAASGVVDPDGLPGLPDTIGSDDGGWSPWRKHRADAAWPEDSGPDAGAAGQSWAIRARSAALSWDEPARCCPRQAGPPEQPAVVARLSPHAAESVDHSFSSRGFSSRGFSIMAGAWWLGGAWLAGATAVGALVLWSRVLLFVFRRRRGVTHNADLAGRIDRLARRLGIRRRVCVLEVPGLSAPVAFGVFRPTIALPASFTGEFAVAEQDAMLAHELAHLSAYDPAWQMLADLVGAALWWHPVAWWSRRRLQAAAEEAADEASLLVPDGPDVLAGCLVALGRRLSGGRQLGWVSVEGPRFRSALGRRVERLLNLRKRCWRSPHRGRLAAGKTVLVAVLVVVTILSTAWARPQASLSEGGTTMKVWQSSWRRSLAAVALVALFSSVSGDAVGDTSPAGGSPAAVADENLAGVLQVALQDDGGERRERPRREGGEERGERRERRVEREGEGPRERPDREPPREEEAERRGAAERERQEIMQHRRELVERAEQIHRELRELPDDADERGQDLERELHEIKQKLGEIEQHLRGPEQGVPPEMMRRLEELKGEIHRLSEEGRHDEAERLKREGRELMAEIQRRRGGERGERPHPEVPPDLERRLHHVRVAAENLHAAGLHDQAERLLREAEAAMRGHREGRQPEPDRPRPEERPGPQHLEQAVRELHEQMGQMRRQMEEMRGALRELMERQRGEGPDR